MRRHGLCMAGGSSPHTRGARSVTGLTRGSLRIIPAYAGSTAAAGVPSATAWDHPRIRGEHGGVAAVMSGSEGIIPAYAGSTGMLLRPAVTTADHPRIRGEHPIVCSIALKTFGSSPHTRGAPVVVAAPGRFVGIIPAYAGSTATAPTPARPRRHHPRIRGEHGPRREAPEMPEGSSPHTRGARHGSSTPGGGSLDHPRIRGEHATVLLTLVSSSGSSPHTRGAPCRTTSASTWTGIIPAYAGST